MTETTLQKIKNNRCYCVKRQKDIPLSECNIGDCVRWKKCTSKTNKEVEKNLKED